MNFLSVSIDPMSPCRECFRARRTLELNGHKGRHFRQTNQGRRMKNNSALELFVCHSVHENKLIRIEQRAAKNLQAMLADQSGRGFEFSGRRLALKGERKSAPNLAVRVSSRFAFQPLREKPGRLHDKT